MRKGLRAWTEAHCQASAARALQRWWRDARARPILDFIPQDSVLLAIR